MLFLCALEEDGSTDGEDGTPRQFMPPGFTCSKVIFSVDYQFLDVFVAYSVILFSE
jgi:hypothetical protein